MSSAVTACTAAAGGGVAAVLVGIGVLTSHCYDYLDVTVLDAQGRRTCAATVTASRNNSSEHFELESCYYTPLSDGRWTIRATLPGTQEVQTTVDVAHENDCTRQVQSVELTLNAPPSNPARAAPQPAIPATNAIPTPSASSVPPKLVAPAATSSAAPDAGPPSSAEAGAPNVAAPDAGGASAIGVFPNSPGSSP